MLPESHPLHEAEAMLLLWYAGANPEHYVEFRALLPRDDPRRGQAPEALIEACRVRTLEESFDTVLADWIMRQNRDRRDVHFGVCPRATLRYSQAGRPLAGRNADIEQAMGAWVDIDTPRWRETVLADSPPATFIVATGNGCHLYFRYAEPRPVREAVEDCKRLTVRYGGDDTSDPARLLRIPGTANWKGWPGWIETLPQGKSCSIYRADPDRVFEGLQPTEAEIAASAGNLESLPWDLREAIRLGHQAALPLLPHAERGKNGELDRSQIDYHVMVRLMLTGWSEEQVADVFRDPENGISAKYQEEAKRGNGEHYLQTSIRKAAQRATVERSRWGQIGQELILEGAGEIARAPKLSFAVDSILPTGGMLIVSGPAKVGKSLFVTDLMLLLAGAQGKLLERFGVNAPGNVVYCQAEISRSSLKARLDAVGASRDVLWERLPLKFYCGPFNLLDSAHATALRRALARAKANYVILDPLARYHRGNENSQEVMAAVLGAFEAAGKEVGASGLILVHHHGKPADAPREGVQRIRGASVIGDWGNAHVLLQKRFSDSTGRKFVTVSFELRDAEEPPPINVALDPGSLRFREWSSEEERLAITMGVLERLPNLPRQALIAEVAQELGATKAEASRLIAKSRVLARSGGDNGGGNGAPLTGGGGWGKPPLAGSPTG